jgi:uncharacterized protein with HEPN domain
MPDRARMRLHDALQACDELAEFTAGKSLNDYLQDTQLRRAVERSLEVVGDSFSSAIRIEPELEQVIPDAAVIIGMRNRIAHGYREIKDDVVWESATSGVPRLAQTLRELIALRDRENA